ncbi:uncharacterized protein LOC117168034 [Belonocnema kinseyi]|uniref:uncharacterized protein LOC117168034 n=1 Tax=Belonocnema kinseyi TaxID=2817044 RepID=UPI00143CD800|nr:uncharacterized protein LOC117168034 [Belonocnema kinseyi]
MDGSRDVNDVINNHPFYDYENIIEARNLQPYEENNFDEANPAEFNSWGVDNHHDDIADHMHRFPLDEDDDIFDEMAEEPAENNGDAQENQARPDDNDAHQQFGDNRPLYRGATITVGEIMSLILAILIFHNVDYSCLADMITVINFHCFQENLIQNSLYKFQKYFSIKESQMHKQFYCSICVRQW